MNDETCICLKITFYLIFQVEFDVNRFGSYIKEASKVKALPEARHGI